MFDLIIIGAGPAGIAAGIYAKRAMLDCLIIDKQGIGGQMVLSDLIENYPGFLSISGFELMNKFKEHAEKLGINIKQTEVESISKSDDRFTIKLASEEIQAKSVIIATGAKPKKIGFPGENKFTGRGVSYCATCDGPFFRDMEVAVIGGGDTAAKEANYLTKHAKKVYLIHRRNELRAEKINQEKVFENPKIELIWDSVPLEIQGVDIISHLLINNVKSNEKSLLDVQGVFIFIGHEPNTEFISVKKDENGFILTDENMQTSIKGIFAAGDCRHKRLKQVVTAVGDGALAAVSAEDYINILHN